jgi:glycosyltransferase involved in cell wall biosynthesis
MTDKIRILELIDKSFLGGGQKNILSIARNINRDIFDITVAAGGNGSFFNELMKSDIKFHRIELPKIFRSRYLKYLTDFHLGKKFHIIHSHGGVAGFYSRILKKHNPDVKIVHTIHGIHYLNSDFLRKFLSLSVEQYLVQFTDITICETKTDYINALKHKIADRDKTRIISNGVDLSRFSNLRKNFELKRSLGFKNNDFIIGNISRFDEQKNQQLILQCAYYLIRKYPDMRFVFVGDGRYLGSMKDLAISSGINEYAVFTGEKENIEDYYSIFDIFVLPSFWEGMPYALLEAMAARLPIICSNIPSLLEVVKEGYSALTVNPANMDELFRKISLLYENHWYRNMLSQNAAIEATLYDEQETVRNTEAVYREVMSD